MSKPSVTALWRPSPNFGPRRGVTAPDLIMLHYTAMSCADAACRVLSNPENEVSAHYVLAEDGQLFQLVREEDRAWHAGRGSWGGDSDINSRSIGIEISNTGFQPFPEPQMQVLECLLSDIMTRWSIPAQNVIGHSDTALGRKIDPGGRFDWKRLARQGLSIWPKAGQGAREGACEAADFWCDAQRFGYGYEPGLERETLNAFRLRFRPWAVGALDEEDCALMADLAARWPVAGDV
ncbi:MAG: N-acetylmuramoyl-L-alanine amidase [Pelagimonas sp.]|nr:N-acetylmuramoyl-L-alanine amidase [Pelagimonas sp.]